MNKLLKWWIWINKWWKYEKIKGWIEWMERKDGRMDGMNERMKTQGVAMNIVAGIWTAVRGLHSDSIGSLPKFDTS